MTTISNLVVHEPQRSRQTGDEADTPTTPKAFRFPPSVSSSHQAATSSGSQTPSQEDQAQPANLPQIPARDSEGPDSLDDDAMDIDDEKDDQKDSDLEGEGEGDEDGDGEGDAASRKKKGQRFFCTGFPPCNLSFTRSEHLARHIRKHTGERPFQCHCNRRFSRLDNLRQHAQTVHVNEDIPGDSLAATGTRFQRQIRTDRVQRGPRPRSGTMSSAGGHSRGHSRNLSASSIGSTTSNYSTVTEAKRRPPPLLMANDSSRPKLGLDPPNTPPPPGHYLVPYSPGGLSTPTSATFSAAPGSPGFAPAFGSPMSTASRMSSYQEARTPHRRLSVPSGPHPYHTQYGAPYSIPPSAASSTHGSAYGSPNQPQFNAGPVYNAPPGEDWRRRTWHPSTFSGPNHNYGRPATSGLLYSQTPDAPQPTYAQHATATAGQAPRLPGIESFDHVRDRGDRGSSPPRRQPSPLHVPDFGGHLHQARPSDYPPLDDNGQVARPASWGQQAIDDIRRVGAPPMHQGRPMDMGPPSSMSVMHPSQQIAHETLPVHPSGRPHKRQAWYSGPPNTRTSPEDSSSSEGIPTPGTSTVEVHPMIMPSSGMMEAQHSMMPGEAAQQACFGPAGRISSPYLGRTSERERTTSFGAQSSNGGEMNRLEALVAVATRDDANTAHHTTAR